MTDKQVWLFFVTVLMAISYILITDKEQKNGAHRTAFPNDNASIIDPTVSALSRAIAQDCKAFHYSAETVVSKSLKLAKQGNSNGQKIEITITCADAIERDMLASN
ncbi:MAG: hypothetical protein HRU25_00545 [Psychrobium sp.]|nr:hypothetical protein [Psychrobium sp.]